MCPWYPPASTTYVPSDKIISGYDLSYTISVLSDGQIKEMEVPNVSTSMTTIQVIGLLATRHSI